MTEIRRDLDRLETMVLVDRRELRQLIRRMSDHEQAILELAAALREATGGGELLSLRPEPPASQNARARAMSRLSGGIDFSR